MTITPGVNSTILNTKNFTPLPYFNVDFELKAKCFNQEGDLKYEYNAFRNLRLEDNSLNDFRTDKLNFNLNSPIDITVQPSYDGTVNLILNDDRNPPRLINSRFTAIEDKRYKIIDRKGNNDTNIYDLAELQQNTRLFKTTEKVPCVLFDGLYEGGALQAGNYVFYFKYCDADGNETDIITESGIISSYVGKINDPFSIRGGLADELTNKIVKLRITNLDTSYDYMNIYFTRSTSDYTETEITTAYKIINKKSITDKELNLTITGLEDVEQISIAELNIQYNIVDKVKTQAQVQNMLVFANVDKPTIPYKELEDLSIRIYPTVSNNNNIGAIDHNYQAIELPDDLRKSEYYDAANVYKYTGYWNKEIYRVGVVYILKDDSLSPVFNVRGKNKVGGFANIGNFNSAIGTEYTNKPLYDTEGKRSYIEYDDEGFVSGSNFDLENTKGVIRLAYGGKMINKDNRVGTYPLAIDFNIGSDVMAEIKKYAKGFFFVRQKRIPTILAQGITIGVDDISFTPSIYANVPKSGTRIDTFITESFIDKSNQLVNDFHSRLLLGGDTVSIGGMLCPEAQLRSEYFNEIFTGALFNISRAPFTNSSSAFNQSNDNDRHFYIKNYLNQGADEQLYTDVKLTNIEDNVPLKYSGTKTFSSRAGIPEEAWRYSWYGTENKSRYANNLIRGAYTGFTGMENYKDKTEIMDIHTPGFNLANLRDYFLLRANSFHSFYSISNRYDVNLIDERINPYEELAVGDDSYTFTEYRGDCFIGNYTVRIQRNFLDPEVPLADTILDSLTWKNNYTGFSSNGSLDKENIGKINRADVNAVRLGHWVTFKICSNINLAYRAIDETHSTEVGLSGKYRGFYPLNAMSTRAESKIPDSTVVNVGYNSTTSDKQYVTLPDVPYIKNIFENRIMFSDIHVNDAFKNNYRVFQGLDYKDITRQYGAIVKIFEWKTNLLVVFENGVGLVPINERALAGTGAGGEILIKGAGVLSENIIPLSTNYGSSWRDSIISTTGFVYGVDTTAKKIWRTNGENFEIVSDFKMQKFLNDNITLGETEKTPMIAIRNVKTHYNAFKGDVMFTFYDSTRDDEEIEWNICFNEQLGKWATRYSWTPAMSESIDNVYFSFDKDSAKKMSLIGYTLDDSETAEGITLSDVNINSINSSTIGTLKLKGYEYYKKYSKVFSLVPDKLDNNLFSIAGDTLSFNGVSNWEKYSYRLKVRVDLLTEGQVVQTFYDFIAVKVNRDILNMTQREAYDTEFSTYFWKHGQAGIFDITTPIEPTKWYDKQEVFEYEFIVSDGPAYHKIFDNLYIISNNAEPHSFEFEVVGDSYAIDKSDPNLSTGDVGDKNALRWTDVQVKGITTHQLGKDLKKLGRLQGNMHYLEDSWRVEIKPHRIQEGQIKETRIRDKYCRIRVRYSGTKLALITALNTLYTVSHA